ncbi:MAG: tRNA pseudouridine(55) synthase TruB, partial [Alphaproteobacteria bacterium]|nr:tRNA pseudouridine(55) synthase TruB [Alphaproteobacteria bacterium]
MDGWIILDKDSGLFSRTAGARVARLFQNKKFGHIGTLDPMASGVLPIA